MLHSDDGRYCIFTRAALAGAGISRRVCVCVRAFVSVRPSVTRRYCITSRSAVADKPARRAASRQTAKF